MIVIPAKAGIQPPQTLDSHFHGNDISRGINFVIPVKTGIQSSLILWIPASAGMTTGGNMKQYYVYILASQRNGTLYTGVTSDLIKRVYEHKNNLVDGFTKKYNVHNLVYFEEANEAISAITREKQIKKWKRQWKLELIEKVNPEWKDLYYDLLK